MSNSEDSQFRKLEVRGSNPRWGSTSPSEAEGGADQNRASQGAGGPYLVPAAKPEKLRKRAVVGPLERKANRDRTFRLVLIGLLSSPTAATAMLPPHLSIKLNLVADLSPADRAALESRFWSKVEKTSTCWLWRAAKTDEGYGVFALLRRRGKKTNAFAHRVAWELERGPIAAGLTIDHVPECKCVNPAHMEPVTIFENNRRRDERRARRGAA